MTQARTIQATQSMQGRSVLVTGATGGIGLETARELVRRGADVTILGRDPQKTARVAGEIGAAGTLIADLAETEQVRQVAAEFRDRVGSLDVLVNNAGAFYTGRQESREGVELTWALNHLAPFLLTRELLPLLRAGQAPRVVTVSSGAHAMGRIHFDDPEFRRGYSGWVAYGQSKLANILFTRELARREGWLQTSTLHPGFVSTGFGGDNPMFSWFSRLGLTPEQGVQTSIHLAADQVLVSGRYFTESRETQPAPQALDDGAAQRLWTLSEGYVDGSGHQPPEAQAMGQQPSN
ncbi:SDR family oxidoreductase [Deinococcus arenicola]|uniref:SDR family oxidoreductase n=1 Tax=Deinococcus arenicola TaxID=2994950 RepID=A0ABU4DSX3_9DEIO|nr:SDR family oxidoreductase [Deinococcus sp. ZS9-10]MDV6375536.1 SDR family oxidoreductase [Deinococcus sp. ZS9-10]